MKYLWLLFLSVPIRGFGQDCRTTHGELDQLIVSTNGKYILAKVNQKGLQPLDKIFSAENGLLLFKYPSTITDSRAKEMGFEPENESGFWGKEKFVYQSASGVDIEYANFKAIEKTPLIKYERFVNTSSSTGYWIWKITLPDGKDSITHTGTNMQYYYNYGKGWGLLSYTAPDKKRYKRYLVYVDSVQQKTLKASYTDKNENADLDYLVYLPQTERVILQSGDVINLKKKEVIKTKIFAYPRPIFKNARVNEEETLVSVTGDVNIHDALQFSTETYAVTKKVNLSSHLGNGYTGKSIAALHDMNSFVYASTCCEQLAVIVRNGQKINLCDKDPADKDNYKERWLAKYGNASEKDKPTAADANRAYEELLSDLRGLDWHFDKKARKIVSAGSSSWVLYGARSGALDILTRQQDAIQSFIKIYGTFISQGARASLGQRLQQISDAYANIPKN